MKKLSLIIACYNQEKYLAEAVESVVKVFAKLDSCEIVLWDDCSTDSTYEIATSFQQTHPDLIRVKRSSENLGVAKCSASMVEEAQGEYIMVFDHDDVMVDFDIPAELKFLDDHPEYSCSYGRKLLFSDEKGLHNGSVGSLYSDFRLLLEPTINNNGMIMRRKDIMTAGNYQETPQGKASGAADIFMWIRLRLQGLIRFDNSVRVLHRIHPNQVTNMTPEKKELYRKDYRFFLEYVCQRYPVIAESLKSGKNLSLKPEQCHIALIILGGLIRNATKVDELNRYLFYAKQLAPKDYGVNLEVGDFYMQMKNYDKALASFSLVSWLEDDASVKMKAFRKIEECYRVKNYPLNELTLVLERYSQKLFAQTPEVELAIKELKRYN